MANVSDITDITEANSPALKFDSKLLEMNDGDKITTDKTTLAIQIFDQLLPEMGVYARLMRRVRNILFSSIYSDNYSTNNENSIQRQTFYTLLRNIETARNERADDCQLIIDRLKKAMLDRDIEGKKMNDEIEELTEQLSLAKKEIIDLKEIITSRNEEINILKSEFDVFKNKSENLQLQLDSELNDLQDQYRSAVKTIDELSVFKEGYDQLENKFSLKIPVVGKKAKLSHQQLLESDLQNAIKLEHQLLTTQNALLESMDNGETTIKSFIRQMNLIENELNLLKNHSNRINLELKKTSKPVDSKGLITGLDNNNDEINNDKFIVNERLMSKYSAVLYTSDNSKIFHELKGVNFCPSCQLKVFICPHSDETSFILELPQNTSMIKITRPLMTTNSILTTKLQKNGKHKKPSIQTDKTEDEKKYAINTIDSILDDLVKKRNNFVRQIPRVLSLSRCLQVLEEFFAFFIKNDETRIPFRDRFYSFFKQKYSHDVAAFLSSYDFVQSLISYNKVLFIKLFLNILAGNLDETAIIYVLLINDVLSTYKFSTLKDIHLFASVLYPTMTNDQLEEYVMSYTSWSKNKVNRKLFADYQLNLVLRWKEPRLLETYSALQLYAEEEFDENKLIEAADLLGITDINSLKDYFYVEKKNLYRLTQIFSYLELIQNFGHTKDNIYNKMDKVLEREPDLQNSLICFTTICNN